MAILVILILQCGCNQDLKLSKIQSINSAKEIEITELDRFLSKTMDSLKIPGLSFAIINNSKVVFHRAIGLTNNEINEPVNDSTIFEVASISKPAFAYFTKKMAKKSIIDCTIIYIMSNRFFHTRVRVTFIANIGSS